MLTGGGNPKWSGSHPFFLLSLWFAPRKRLPTGSCARSSRPENRITIIPCGHAIHSEFPEPRRAVSCLFLHGSCRHVNIADMTTNARSETRGESRGGYVTGLFRSCLYASIRALKLNGSMTGRTTRVMLASQANRVPAENCRTSIHRYRSGGLTGGGSYPRWLISIHA